MANFTTNFSSWSGFEALMSAVQAYESSANYASVENSLASLEAHVMATPVSSSATSTTATLFYTGGVVAYLYGYNLGTPSAVITRMDITDSFSTISMSGTISGQNPDAGAFTSYTYTGFGYFEQGVGHIPLDETPAIFTS